MLRAFKYRIYPNKKQKQVIEQTLETCRYLYNDFLSERKIMYQFDGTQISYNWQANSLPHRKKINPYQAKVHSQILQDVARRIDKTYKSFFRRVRAGETPGYPRYKGKGQYDSFTYPQSGYALEKGKLKLSSIGGVKIRLHRPLEGNVKNCSIIHKNDKYYASFSCETESSPLDMTGRTVGIDIGVTDFCITSDGTFFPSPSAYRKAEKDLQKAQREVSRRKKGSKRRKKAVAKLAKAHEKVSNQRRDIAHKVANKLINKYDLIAHEKLGIKNMVKNKHLSKSISDAGWGMFFRILACKAESAGRKVIEVDLYNTSQVCNECGNTVKKKLNERWHCCPVCGCSVHRDINAARNILKKVVA